MQAYEVLQNFNNIVRSRKHLLKKNNDFRIIRNKHNHKCNEIIRYVRPKLSFVSAVIYRKLSIPIYKNAKCDKCILIKQCIVWKN